MTENNIQDHIPNKMDVTVVIDKEKLPEDVRKLLEEMLERPPPTSDRVDKDSEKSIESKSIESTDNRLFTIQTGTVVGNIYADGIYKKEE